MLPLLQSIPKVESPLFPFFLRNGMFGQFQMLAEQMNQHGYALIDLGRERMAALAQEIRAELDPVFAEMRCHLADLRIQDAWQQVQAVKQVALYPVVMEILEQLYGRRPFAFQTLNFPVGTQQPLHSDAVYFHSEPPGFMCGVWVALEDIHPDSGPLEFVPGSQRLPWLHPHDVGVYSGPGVPLTQEIFHEAWTSMLECQGLQRQVFLPKMGEALIWTANLLHGGSAVADVSRSRWSQVTHYYFESCGYYTPLHSRWPHGSVDWRHPLDVSTGRPVQCGPMALKQNDQLLPLTQRLVQFDPEAYLSVNPDVAAEGMNAFEHLVRYGLQEGRAWC